MCMVPGLAAAHIAEGRLNVVSACVSSGARPCPCQRGREMIQALTAHNCAWISPYCSFRPTWSNQRSISEYNGFDELRRDAQWWWGRGWRWVVDGDETWIVTGERTAMEVDGTGIDGDWPSRSRRRWHRWYQYSRGCRHGGKRWWWRRSVTAMSASVVWTPGRLSSRCLAMQRIVIQYTIAILPS